MAIKLTLKESLERIEELENTLKKLGVPLSLIPTIMEHIEEYADLRAGLDLAREKQFEDDAYEMLLNMNAASNKNTEKLAKFLRDFAEHVVAWTLNHASPTERNNVQALTDKLPLFYRDESEDEECCF